MRLTLSPHHYERYLRNRPVGGELVVDFVNFLETGLIFQTKDQDNCIHPTCKLKRNEEERRSGLMVRTKKNYLNRQFPESITLSTHLSIWELCLFSDY